MRTRTCFHNTCIFNSYKTSCFVQFTFPVSVLRRPLRTIRSSICVVAGFLYMATSASARLRRTGRHVDASDDADELRVVQFHLRHRWRLRGGRCIAGVPARRADVQFRARAVADKFRPRRRRGREQLDGGGRRGDSVPVRTYGVRGAPRDRLLQRLLLVTGASHPPASVLGAGRPQHQSHPQQHAVKFGIENAE